ncbi:hypothetical protein BS50DRAFT_111454 [Corynespora cassiicola Philippines]|uniref:Uncharacterized protein n=1 Tax=Corynespora cassiicola Philippines TaxID=1448308 RepID=A0A2T2ND84_CORCC|nr:hypothetical protein BS50DRAFT_111454 [Corynespora cassiicola Philippines]
MRDTILFFLLFFSFSPFWGLLYVDMDGRFVDMCRWLNVRYATFGARMGQAVIWGGD